MVKCLCLWTANWERQDVHDDGLECDSLVSEQERQQTTSLKWRANVKEFCCMSIGVSLIEKMTTSKTTRRVVLKKLSPMSRTIVI